MRALLLREQKPVEEGPLSFAELPTPEPGPGQILIRVLACGVCHTDLHIAEGDLPLRKSPLVLGHQVVGEVMEVGPGVSRLEKGQRVGLAWLGWTCGTCKFCQKGQENLCPNAQFTGYTLDGGFAEYVLGYADFAYPLNLPLPPEKIAPLLCAGIIGFRALRLSGIEPGGKLGLYGFGASAHLAIQVAGYWNCDVYVFTRSQEHKDLAWELGAKWVGNPTDRPPDELDAAVIFAPAGPIVHEALRSIRPGGTVVAAGIHMSPIPETPYHLIYGERVLRTVANATSRDGLEFLELAAAIPVEPNVEVYPWREANTVLSSLKAGKIRGSAVLIMD